MGSVTPWALRAVSLLLLMSGTGAIAQPSAVAPVEVTAPEHAREVAEELREVIPLGTPIDEAQTLARARGLFCTWGGSPLIESVGVRFLLCSESCTDSRRDGWWVYLSAQADKGVRFIEPGLATHSVIKPLLPDGCPP